MVAGACAARPVADAAAGGDGNVRCAVGGHGGEKTVHALYAAYGAGSWWFPGSWLMNFKHARIGTLESASTRAVVPCK